MKKLFAFLLITLFTVTFAQNTDNRFSNSEYEQQEQSQSSNSSIPVDNQDEGPGNPGPPVPINNHLPILFVAAVGIIAVSQYRKTRISQY